MKKISTLIMSAFAMIIGLGNSATAQVEEGSMIFDTYYGFPNATVTLYNGLYTDNSETEIRGIGGTGFRFEYMLADNLGVGAEYNYVFGSAKYTVTDTFTVWNGSAYEDSVVNYSVERSVTKMRFLARFNYHFVATDVVDGYIGFAGGYKYRNTTWTSTNPNGSEDEVGGLFDGVMPVAVRVAIGARFFFTPWMGANMELGLGGGPVVSGGLTFKF
jgi:hypothetical protein